MLTRERTERGRGPGGGGGGKFAVRNRQVVVSPKFKPQGVHSLLFRVTPLGYLETTGFAGWSFITRTRLAEIAKN